MKQLTRGGTTGADSPPPCVPLAVRAGEQHPLLLALDQLDTITASMAAAADAWQGLEPLTIREACTRIRKARARLDGQVMKAGRVLDALGTAKNAGATSTGAMLATDYGGNRRETDQLISTGVTITQAGATRTESELLDGSITPQQAQIIGRGLLTLPADTSEEDRATCESTLLAEARRCSLTDLRRAADRVREPIRPPATVDADEDRIVEQRERRAWRLTEFSLTDLDDGTSTGRFRIPHVQAAMLRTLLEAQAAPRRRHLEAASQSPTESGRGSPSTGLSPDEHENLTYQQRLGRAFSTLIEHIPTEGYATTGGTPAAVTITMHVTALRDGLAAKVAVLGTGATMSAGAARRLACEHGIIPAVLGGSSLPLDYGRTRRLFSATQRHALTVRDRGCAFPGCDRPPAWCESHHIVPFSRGGTTDARDGVLLCARHHHLVHDDGWDVRLHPDTGHPQFRGGTYLAWRTHSRFRRAHASTPSRPRPADDLGAQGQVRTRGVPPTGLEPALDPF